MQDYNFFSFIFFCTFFYTFEKQRKNNYMILLFIRYQLCFLQKSTRTVIQQNLMESNRRKWYFKNPRSNESVSLPSQTMTWSLVFHEWRTDSRVMDNSSSNESRSPHDTNMTGIKNLSISPSMRSISREKSKTYFEESAREKVKKSEDNVNNFEGMVAR